MNIPSRTPITRQNQPPTVTGATPAPARARRLVVPDAEMRRLIDGGEARPLSRIVTSLVRLEDQWWLESTDEWLVITDHEHAAKLDRWAARSK